ncbi:MAG: hypothetical protein ACOCUI_00720 [bacterium]
MKDKKIKVSIAFKQSLFHKKEKQMTLEAYKKMISYIKNNRHGLNIDDFGLYGYDSVTDCEIDFWDVEIEYQNENGEWVTEDI